MLPVTTVDRRPIGDGRPGPVVQRLLAAYYGTCTHLDEQIGRVLDHLESLGLAHRTRVLYTSDHGECLGARGIYGKFTLYDESAAVPMIAAGPDIPVDNVVDTPVSLVDVFPTAIECVGASPHAADGDVPGRSLWQMASEPNRERTVFSEYHAVGSRGGSFMLRDGRYKYNHYVGQAPQLFDMREDPEELEDLSADALHAKRLAECEKRLRELVDPEAVDAAARADQRAKVEAFGGEEAVRSRGAFDNSPVPGEAPAFRPH